MYLIGCCELTSLLNSVYPDGRPGYTVHVFSFLTIIQEWQLLRVVYTNDR